MSFCSVYAIKNIMNIAYVFKYLKYLILFTILFMLN